MYIADRFGNMLISSRTTRLAAIYFGLVGLVAVVFLQTGHFNFVNYDDGLRFRKPEYPNGIDLAGCRLGLYSCSFAKLASIDVDFPHGRLPAFGLNAGAHHLVNVGLHAAAAYSVHVFVAIDQCTLGERD